MIESTVDSTRDLTRHTCHGRVTAQEIAQVVEIFYQGKPTRLVLWDFREADLRDVVGDDVRWLASRVKHMAHSRVGGKTAIVASDDIAFAWGRMYALTAEVSHQQVPVRTFRDLDEAEKWLFSDVYDHDYSTAIK